MLCFSLTACGLLSAEEPSSSSPEVTLEDYYAQLVKYATEGQYLEGWRLYTATTELHGYNDADAYNDYCTAMRSYEAGGIGAAYELLKKNPALLDSQTKITEIESRIAKLNGTYKADNGQGAYLYTVIENGKVMTKVVAYGDDTAEFAYTEDDLTSELVISKYNDGTEFVAIGRYSSIGAKLTINYVINTFDDSTDIMIIAFEGAEYTTFNGLYSKIA